MTPLQIEILLHYHYSPRDYPNLSPPSQQDAISYFLNSGFLTKTDLHEDMPATTPNYQSTEKLDAFCRALCSVPEPVQRWDVGPSCCGGAIEKAHMAGQIDAGVDPSLSNAQAYFKGLARA